MPGRVGALKRKGGKLGVEQPSGLRTAQTFTSSFGAVEAMFQAGSARCVSTVFLRAVSKAYGCAEHTRRALHSCEVWSPHGNCGAS